jgi:hypothetical protein
MTADDRRLVLDLTRAEQVRRTVGPTPWVVLEALAGRSKRSAPSVEIESSSRDLGEVLGLSKDTVARALRTLARADLVRRVDRRNDRTGRFAATTYVVDLVAAGLTVWAVDGLSDTAALAATGSTPRATDARRVVGRSLWQLEREAVRPGAGRGPVERPSFERPAGSASDSKPASSQLSLLS